MKKKILGIAIVVLSAVILATPAYAGPENGQKVPIVMHWAQLTATPAGPPKVTGNVMHNHGLVNWSVSVDVDGVLGAWTGFANNTIRKTLLVNQTDGFMVTFHETYDMKFEGYDGGFKGSAMILMKYVYTPDAMGKAHGLLRGYGDFEGQTINAGHSWKPSGPIMWEGYLLTK
jgi:hypothetical protein